MRPSAVSNSAAPAPGDLRPGGGEAQERAGMAAGEAHLGEGAFALGHQRFNLAAIIGQRTGHLAHIFGQALMPVPIDPQG